MQTGHHTRSTAITDVMHRHVVTADISTTAQTCAALIAREHIGCLIILKQEKPVGIITERSFVQLVKRGAFDPKKVRAADFMSSPLITISADASFAVAVELFNRKGVKRMPVVRKGKIIGLLSLKDMIEFSNLALAHLEERHQKLKTEASLDALTGTLNKQAITRELHKEYDRICRYGGRSSVLFLDIDHFKNINDTYSHLAGDQVLKELGTLLRSVCRQIDIIGRFGGEEFMVIAPNRKKYHAAVFGERLRQAIEKHVFRFHVTDIRLTVSMGIASLFDGRSCLVTLARADQALYYAKKMGRNRIGLWNRGTLSIAAESKEL